MRQTFKILLSFAALFIATALAATPPHPTPGAGSDPEFR